jgi:hypothetical protein
MVRRNELVKRLRLKLRPLQRFQQSKNGSFHCGHSELLVLRTSLLEFLSQISSWPSLRFISEYNPELLGKVLDSQVRHHDFLAPLMIGGPEPLNHLVDAMLL